MPNSTASAGFTKPRPDFPLFPHATGRWAKKIRGKFHYFGRCADDPKGEAALALWLEQKDDLLAGRTPRTKQGEVTLRELADRFMVSQRHKMEAGELAAVSFADYYATCKRILDFFGPSRPVVDLAPDDFERFRASMAKNWGPVTLANEITRIRVLCKYGWDNRLIPAPVNLGTEFRRPRKKVLRAARRLQQQANGKRMFSAEEIRAVLAVAKQPMKAMVLLAINCGFGNKDLMDLPTKAVDLDAGWVDFPRPKTEIDRRCPLWPETVAAIREWLTQRPQPKSRQHAHLLFLTYFGQPWGTRTVAEVTDEKTQEGKLVVNADDPVSKEFSKLLKSLGLKRKGVSFYALRHTFETIGGGSRDQVAVDAIMGHADGSMAAAYREEIGDDRLKGVTDHVHNWLFGSEGKAVK